MIGVVRPSLLRCHAKPKPRPAAFVGAILGYATAAVEALVTKAREASEVRRIVAHTPLERPESGRVLEDATRGQLTITSLAEESRPPAATGDHPH